MDTGHLTLTRDDLVEAIEVYAQRLAGVHLKDWTPRHGGNLHSCAKGFVELGQGVVPLAEVLETLRRIRFDGWVVLEQDSTSSDPRTSLEASASCG